MFLAQKLMAKAAAGASDPYFANVFLLLHMDGADNGTTFTDQKGHTFSSVGAVTKTAAPKFGSACAYFNSTSYISTPDSTDFTLGNYFTIETFVKLTGAGRYICGQSNVNGTVAGPGLWIDGAGHASGWGSQANIIYGSTVINDGNWHHVALVNNNGTLYLYVDGVSDATPIAAGTITDSSSSFSIGRLGDYTGGVFDGYLDEFRLTKGVARYTSNFSVPTAPFPDQ